MKPYEIAKENNIFVIAEPLADILGYYSKIEGQKFIHINSDLPEYYQRYIVAFCLYGALHDPDNMLFFKRKQANRFSKQEKDANLFACRLLLDSEHGIVTLLPEERKALHNRFKSLWTDFDGTLEEFIQHAIRHFEKE